MAGNASSTADALDRQIARVDEAADVAASYLRDASGAIGNTALVIEPVNASEHPEHVAA